MKKKLLSTLLCAAMAVSMLAGCGGSDSNAAADNSTASDATVTCFCMLCFYDTTLVSEWLVIYGS